MIRYATPLSTCDQVKTARQDGRLRVTMVSEISADDPYLAGHFPEVTIFPGVFVLESVTQAVIGALGERHGRLPRLHAVRSIRFLIPLYPGDRLVIEADVDDPQTDRFRVTADCRRGDGRRVATMAVWFRWSP